MQADLTSKTELKYIKARTHGGISLKKRRKVKRPLVPNAITHIVLKSSKATGELSFYKNKTLVSALLKARAKKYFVEILDFVNMGSLTPVFF